MQAAAAAAVPPVAVPPVQPQVVARKRKKERKGTLTCPKNHQQPCTDCSLKNYVEF